MINLKLKAGALQLTMYVVVVIALLLAGFILFIHTHKKFSIQTQFVKETIANAEAGINYTLQNSLIKNDSVSVHIFDEDYKTLKVHKDYWGLFEKVTSVSKIKNNTFTKIALIGAAQSKRDRTALFVKDNNRPLVVVGNTHIEGTAYLPLQGVRTGNIAGQSYYGNQLIYGSTKNSKSALPKLSKELLTELKLLEQKVKTAHPDQFINIGTKREFQNSFFKPLQIVFSPNYLLLSEIRLSGHILVQSNTKIVIDASTYLNDVILIAPEIEIKSSVKGVFQVFAKKKIILGNNCKLDYPSVLYINERNHSTTTNNYENTSYISIGKNSEVKGIVTYLGTTKNYKPQIFIDEKSKVTGEVYCNKNLELLGTVNGSVYTSNFIANQSGSSYQNHIYNAVINVNELSESYIGLPFQNTNKGIAKWLY